LESELGQPVVAAVEALQCRGQPYLIDAGYFPDVRSESHGLERAGAQSAALAAEGIERCPQTPSDATGRGEVAQEQGSHGARATGLSAASAARKVTGVNSTAATESSSRGNTSRITGTPSPVTAAWPSCSSRMSPGPRPWVSLPSTASALALTVSKPRR